MNQFWAVVMGTAIGQFLYMLLEYQLGKTKYGSFLGLLIQWCYGIVNKFKPKGGS